MKAAPKQLTGAHLYLDIAKPGYLFHGYSSGMNEVYTRDKVKRINLCGQTHISYLLFQNMQ